MGIQPSQNSITRSKVVGALPPEEGPKTRRCGDPLLSGGKPSKLVFGQPVFSPDGRSVVVAVNCNLYQGVTGSLPASLFEASLDGAAVRPLGSRALPLPPRPGDLWTELKFPSVPRFSPDGRRIAQSIHVSGAACAQSKDQVLLADADGANSGELTLAALAGIEAPFGYLGGIIGYDWSPLGDAIVASVDVSICRETYTPRGEPFLAGLYMINLDGEFEAELVAGPTSSPAWSPSGRYIAYVAQESFGQEAGPLLLRVIDLTTREVVDLGQGEQPAWRPQAASSVIGYGGPSEEPLVP